jgi:hypothetical protein
MAAPAGAEGEAAAANLCLASEVHLYAEAETSASGEDAAAGAIQPGADHAGNPAGLSPARVRSRWWNRSARLDRRKSVHLLSCGVGLGASNDGVPRVRVFHARAVDGDPCR